MNNERAYQILVEPVVSEKSTRVAEDSNQVVFRVVPDATKPEIRAAVEMLFKVNVERVTTINVKGKRKRFGQVNGRRANSKKAYVTLAKGQEIDFLGGAE